jgi:hypothetical protein
MVLFVAGLVLIVAGAVGIWQNLVLTWIGHRVPGTVTDLQWRVTGNEGGGFVRDYKVILAFQTLDGQPVETVTRMGRRRPIVQPGDQVPVVYDPRRPNRAEIDTRQGRATWIPVALGLLGLALIAFGLYGLVSGHG